jgi:hypothetical protein
VRVRVRVGESLRKVNIIITPTPSRWSFESFLAKYEPDHSNNEDCSLFFPLILLAVSTASLHVTVDLFFRSSLSSTYNNGRAKSRFPLFSRHESLDIIDKAL